MRIVAGKYGGRRLQVPKNRDIRPTTDKVRGAVFNALASRGVIDGARVLDLFCGTGALGLEALSRGAAHCTFIDKIYESLELAKVNVFNVGADNEAAFLQQDATQIAEVPEPYDLVFLDPPYGKDLVLATLEGLHECSLLVDQATVVVETEKQFISDGHVAYAVIDERLYGDTKITYMLYKGMNS